MPVIQPGGKVLVTGANGFLAIWTVQRLLDRGYSVRGTVRSESKGAYLKEYFKSYVPDRFEIVVVPDISAEGAFDESLVGVTGVLHMAAPLPNEKIEDPQEYIKPAVDSIMAILKSARTSPTVKAIVFTSTAGALMKQSSDPITFTEKDWNDEASKVVEEQGKSAPAFVKYFLSKILAEKAAWKFYEENKETLPFGFTVILPTYIFGPPVQELGSEASCLGPPLNFWYNICLDNPSQPRADDVLSTTLPYADVRDLADAHITALETEEASGERIIVSGEEPSWQQWIDTVQKVQSSVAQDRHLPKGKPGIAPKAMISFDGSKGTRILGVKFRDIQETTRDMMEIFTKKGW